MRAIQRKPSKELPNWFLTLIKLISQLLEREAVRRVDTGTLSEIEIQKLGLTLRFLRRKFKK